jgi:hypothetical protein
MTVHWTRSDVLRGSRYCAHLPKSSAWSTLPLPAQSKNFWQTVVLMLKLW